MLYICYGMLKSASTFAFQIAIDIAQTHSDRGSLMQKLPQDLRASFIPENLGLTLQKINEFIPKEEIYVIKTHCKLDEETEELLSKGLAKAMISYRDPYDIVVSLKDAGDIERRKDPTQQRPYFTKIKDYQDALKRLPYIMADAEPWLKEEKIHRIQFSEIASDPIKVAQEMANYMGVTVDQSKITQIIESYTSNKKSIIEFNVGIKGRGHKEFSLPETDPIKQEMDRFLKLYF